MSGIIPGRVTAGVLALALALGSHAAAAAPAQLIVYGAEEDGIVCAAAAERLNSFAAPDKVQCLGSEASAPFTEMGAPLLNSHEYHSNIPALNSPFTSPRGEMLVNLGALERTSGSRLEVSIPELAPGEFVAVVLRWEQAPGASSQLDLCVVGSADFANVCTGASEPGAAPTRVLLIGNPTRAVNNTRAQTVTMEVGLASGVLPNRISLAAEDNGARAVVARPADREGIRPQLNQNQPQVDVQLNLNPTTINVGQSATLTWSATNADTCTASAMPASTDWSGNKPSSGSLMVTPPSANSYSYTLACTNSDSQAMETQVLTVLTPSSGGGGGAFELIELALLAGLSGARMLGQRMTRVR